MIDPTRINSAKNREYFSGYLIRASENAVEEIPFRYGLAVNRSYMPVTSSLPGMEYVSPTETIRTSRVDLPFRKNDKIKLADGRVLSVQNITPESSACKALMGGAGTTAYILTLEGGGNV
jgi:hypothetical protein